MFARPVGFVFWPTFIGLLITIVSVAGRPTPLAQALAAVVIALVSLHAVATLGWLEAAAFAGLCLIVSFSIENLGVTTGFPFGHYHFLVGNALPKVGAIPIVVGPLYFGMGYPAGIIANLILNGSLRRPSDVTSLVAVPVMAAFVMVQWDAVMDPPNATIAQAWVWHDGGGFFGVPLSNFFGWFLTTYTYFQLFSLVLFLRPLARPWRLGSRAFTAIPVLLYMAAGLCNLPPLRDPDTSVTDGGGGVWSASAIRQTAVLVMLVTMLPSGAVALIRLGALRPLRSTDRHVQNN